MEHTADLRKMKPENCGHLYKVSGGVYTKHTATLQRIK